MDSKVTSLAAWRAAHPAHGPITGGYVVPHSFAIQFVVCRR